MSIFSIHTAETAPEASRAILDGAKRKFGFVPNLLAALAEAPAALEASVSLMDALARSSFTPTEREVVLIAVSAKNGCDYCVAAHSTIAGAQKVPGEVIAALREGRPIADPRLEVLRRFAETVVEARGWVPEADRQAFLAAGFERGQVLEVVLGIAFKTLLNYTDHLVGTPLDEAFAGGAPAAPKAG